VVEEEVMEATIVATLAAVALFLLLANIARSLARRGWRRELRRAVVRERNRNRFGVLRTRLMAQSRDGVIDVKSPIFRSMYSGLTVLMREPHEYAKAALAIMTLPERPPVEQPSRVTRAEAELALEFSDALDRLCRDFSRVYRFLAWCLDNMSPADKGQVRPPPLWVQMLKRPKYGELQQVQNARKRLRDFGTAATATPAPA